MRYYSANFVVFQDREAIVRKLFKEPVKSPIASSLRKFS